MINEKFFILTIVIASAYSLMQLLAWFGFRKIPAQKKQNTDQFNQFSIIVAFRNEAIHLSNFIRQLTQIQYPDSKYEIILIDDDSEDKSLTIAQSFETEKIIVAQSDGHGKKAAIQKGIQLSRFPYIVQTDVDCELPKNWLISFNESFESESTKMIIAPLLIEGHQSKLEVLQQIESLGIWLYTAGFARLGIPIMANAGNMAYSKDVWKEVSLRADLSASGDDLFLMHGIRKKYGNSSIKVIRTKEALVRTHAEDKLKLLWQQRLRWAQKSKHFTNFSSVLIGSITIIAHLNLLVLFFASFIISELWFYFIVVLTMKAIGDLLITSTITSFYGKKNNYIAGVFYSIISILYVPLVGICSQICTFEWKNRKY
ncbi:MAG: glycosyltransferase [Bacteroidales bacterium]|nr:glycosyltransferase [Bacteroidales bacterium]